MDDTVSSPNDAPSGADAPASEPRMSEDALRRRDEDIRRGSNLAARRSREEAKVRERIRERKMEETTRSEESAAAAEQRAREHKEASKSFRKADKRRRQEVEEDKKRREEERLKGEAYQQAIRDKRKKQKEYMHELSAAGEMRFKREREQLDARLNAEKARHDANGKAQFQYNAVDHEDMQAKDMVEKGLRARKGVIEGESRKKLYKLQELHRLKLDALDVEVRSRKNTILRKSPHGNAAMEAELLAFLRQQRRLIDADNQKRIDAVAMEERTLKEQAEEAYRDEIRSIESRTRTKRNTIDRELSRRLDDIAHGKL